MTTPRKSVGAYPSAYGRLFRTAAKYPMHLHFNTASGAYSMRQQLYAFRSALYDQPEYDFELSLIAPYLTFNIEATLSKSTLTIRLDEERREEFLHEQQSHIPRLRSTV